MKTSILLILIIQLLINSNISNCQDTTLMMIDSALYYEIPEQFRISREHVFFTPDSLKKKNDWMDNTIDSIIKKNGVKLKKNYDSIPDTSSFNFQFNKSTLGTISAHGRFTFIGSDGSTKIGKRVKVRVFEKDGYNDSDFSSCYQINTQPIYTDENGNWSLIGINNNDINGLWGRDLYVVYELENIFGRVNDYSDNIPYSWNTWILLPHDSYEDITDGTNVNFDYTVTDDNKPALSFLVGVVTNKIIPFFCFHQQDLMHKI